MNVRVFWGIVGVIGLCACSGTRIDVGPGGMQGGAPGAGGTTSQGGVPSAGGAMSHGTCTTEVSPLPQWPSSTACAGNTDSPVVGRWHGYIENVGGVWDELFLDIQGANSDGLCGTFTVGDMPSPSPATDPTQAYHFSDGVGLTFIPGYASTLLDGRIDGARIRFEVGPTEGYRSWCQLQTSYQRPEGAGGGGALGCLCLPSLSGTVDETPDHCKINYSNGTVLTCAQVSQCNGLCVCNESGCDAGGRFNDSFDLTVSGDTIEGSDTDHPGHRIHFTRLP